MAWPLVMGIILALITKRLIVIIKAIKVIKDKKENYQHYKVEIWLNFRKTMLKKLGSNF